MKPGGRGDTGIQPVITEEGEGSIEIDDVAIAYRRDLANLRVPRRVLDFARGRWDELDRHENLFGGAADPGQAWPGSLC